MKAHIFLIANLKFRLQTPCSFRDMAENVKLIGIPINNFLCIYIIASSPGLHTLFCLWRVNKKLPQGETSQNTFQRSRSISWQCKIHMVKWAHPPLSIILSHCIKGTLNFKKGFSKIKLSETSNLVGWRYLIKLHIPRWKKLHQREVKH